MVVLDGLIILGAGAVFAYLYSQEDAINNFVLKYVWLFVAISLITYSFVGSYLLPETTAIATALGLLLVIVVCILIWRIVKGIRA